MGGGETREVDYYAQRGRDGKSDPVQSKRTPTSGNSSLALLREALAPERLDVAFVEAGSAAQARARLREGGLDAALIDITLPDGNGLDLVAEINDGGPARRIPTVVLTATLESSVAARALEAGARERSPS